MRLVYIFCILSVCHVSFSQRMPDERNVRNRKRGRSGRFRGRFFLQPGEGNNWQMQFNNLNRDRFGNRNHPPWGPRKPGPENLTGTSPFGISDLAGAGAGPDFGPQQRPTFFGSPVSVVSDGFCYYCCRIPWRMYTWCVRRFCIGGGPNCRAFG
ncbi:uncharacterized protein LOC128156022 [Crassostrea angulata]|uniref:uncharacterized protein LOC128156022 n=1 Tax=Magallana angulata TaxID=2784310 RepID=UPI0022B16AC8|nr:uncharacterized protein LOC128156022 [Crassostrea angulata]